MKKVIIIKSENDKYFFNQIKEDYSIYDMYIKKIDYLSFIHKTLSKPIILLGNWKKIIKDVDIAIIFDTMYDSKVGEKIKRINPNCKTILYFWNIIDESRKKYFNDQNIDEFWTFDRDDSNKYQIKYNPQFYTKKCIIPKTNIINDIFFIGREKERKKEIEKIEKLTNLKTDITIIENEKDFIPYSEYLRRLSQSKALLDINIKNQKGLSLRCMESLFFNKKLITNNKDISNYDFYHPNNIFILGKDDRNKLKEFINKKNHPIKKEILEKYDINNWISNFMK